MDKPEKQRDTNITGLNLKLRTPAFKAQLHHDTMRYKGKLRMFLICKMGMVILAYSVVTEVK